MKQSKEETNNRGAMSLRQGLKQSANAADVTDSRWGSSGVYFTCR